MNLLPFRKVSTETKDLILKMLEKNPVKRITPQKSLEHALFTKKFKFKKKNEIT